MGWLMYGVWSRSFRRWHWCFWCGVSAAYMRLVWSRDRRADCIRMLTLGSVATGSNVWETHKGSKVDRPEQEGEGRLLVVLVHEPAVQRLVRRRGRGQRLRWGCVGEVVVRAAVEHDADRPSGVDRSVQSGSGIRRGSVHCRGGSGVLRGTGGGQGEVVRKELELLDVFGVGSRGGQWCDNWRR